MYTANAGATERERERERETAPNENSSGSFSSAISDYERLSLAQKSPAAPCLAATSPGCEDGEASITLTDRSRNGEGWGEGEEQWGSEGAIGMNESRESTKTVPGTEEPGGSGSRYTRNDK